MSKGWLIILKAKVEAEVFYSSSLKWNKSETTLKTMKKVMEVGVHRNMNKDNKAVFYYGPPVITKEYEKRVS